MQMCIHTFHTCYFREDSQFTHRSNNFCQIKHCPRYNCDHFASGSMLSSPGSLSVPLREQTTRGKKQRDQKLYVKTCLSIVFLMFIWFRRNKNCPGVAVKSYNGRETRFKVSKTDRGHVHILYDKSIM